MCASCIVIDSTLGVRVSPLSDGSLVVDCDECGSCITADVKDQGDGINRAHQHIRETHP